MIDYTGFDEKVITMKCVDQDIAGKPMSMQGNDIVKVAVKGDAFLGFGVAERGGYATVQVGGFAKVKVGEGDINLGRAVITADGKGGVVMSTEGNVVKVLYYDYETKIAGIIF